MLDELFELFDRDRRRNHTGTRRRGLLARLFGGSDRHHDGIRPVEDRGRTRTEHDDFDDDDGSNNRRARRRERDPFEFGGDD